jgi:class 3 adenylate cyclase
LSANPEARTTTRRAVQIAREVGDSHQLARAALEHSGAFILVQMGRMDDEMVSLYDECLRALGAEDSAPKARILSSLAVELFFGMDIERIRALHAEAVAVARRVGEPALLAEVLNSSLFGVPIEDAADADRLAIEVLALAEDIGDKELLANALMHRLIVQLGQGKKKDAYESFHREARLGAELRTPLRLYYPKLHECMFALLEGRLADADAANGEAFAIGQRAIQGNAIQWFASVRGLVGFHRGDELSSLIPTVQGMVAEFPDYPVYRIALCQLYVRTGELELARELLDEIAANDFTDIPRDGNFGVNMVWLTTACEILEDPDRAQLLYDMNLPMKDLGIVLGAGAVYYGTYAARLGTICAVLGRLDEAETHFQAALEREQQLGAILWVAETQLSYARLLVQRGRPADRERTRELLNAALETARETGADRIMNDSLEMKLELQGVGSGTLDRSIEAIAHSVDTRRPDFSLHAAPDGTVTLMFSDMEGFTEMTERLGDLAAHEVVQKHNQVVRAATRAHGGHEVELRGDGFLLAFSSARKAGLCAIDLQRQFAAYSEQNPDQPIRIHIGLHTGEAIRDADKFFGKSVIQAFRIADQARGGEILVSSLLKELVEDGGDLRFDEGRELELKGLSGLHRVHALHWHDEEMRRPSP